MPMSVQAVSLENLCPVGSFSPLAHYPGAFLLHSGPVFENNRNTRRNGKSFWGFDPYAVLQIRGNRVSITQGKKTRSVSQFQTKDPLQFLDRFLINEGFWNHPSPSQEFTGQLALGFFSFEAGHLTITPPESSKEMFHDLSAYPEIPEVWPEVWIALYDAVCCYDSEMEILDIPQGSPKTRIYESFLRFEKKPLPSSNVFSKQENISYEDFSNFSKKTFCEKVQKILHYIREGDLYQANLAQRFSLPWDPSSKPIKVFRELTQKNPVPFSAFLCLGKKNFIISCSPERFLKIQDQKILTEPIKGTIGRQANSQLDEENRKWLLQSSKDRAELTMIVDLERNDLGRICKEGSISVLELAELKTFASVHHLVAQIQGELQDHVSPSQIFRATFPGGSITGAPKIRALEVIHELENVPRGIYTGSIGYFTPGNIMDFNIAIRTLMIQGSEAIIHAGSGIVAESVPELEYLETLDKVRPLLEAVLRSQKGKMHDPRRKTKRNGPRAADSAQTPGQL